MNLKKTHGAGRTLNESRLYGFADRQRPSVARRGATTESENYAVNPQTKGGKEDTSIERTLQLRYSMLCWALCGRQIPRKGRGRWKTIRVSRGGQLVSGHGSEQKDPEVSLGVDMLVFRYSDSLLSKNKYWRKQ